MRESDEMIVFGEQDDRSMLHAAKLGIRCKCPNCGEGQMFDGFLKVTPACAVCEEDLSHHRADDLPAYLNIFIVGHIVFVGMVYFMTFKLMGMWETMFLAIAVCLVAAGLLMQPLKGMVVGIQWALRMHGFGGQHD